MSMYPSDGSHALYAKIQSVAEGCGDAPAIVHGDREITYRALIELAHGIAARLARGLGTGTHRLVAVLGSPRPEFVAAMLAVLENGWTYLPLDVHHPRLRNDAILADAGVDATIALGAGSDVEIAVAPRRGLDPETREKLTDRVYVMYTSGSTGAPKGSAASGAAVLNVLDFMRERFELGVSSTMLGVTNFAWDLSVPDIYLPITSGGRLVLLPPDELGDLGAVARTIARYEVDLMQASPSMWKMLVDSGWEGRPALAAVAGGETLPEALARALLPRCRELWNFYGPAECTVWSTCSRVQDPARISLGFALPRTRLHILRDDGELAAPGEPGEIAISGVGLANGYLHRPELTREKFISLATPAGEVAAYRTGDLGHLTEEGELFFLGRRDLMLKIRGHRVEAREVEEHLERHPVIRQAVVFGRGGSVSDTLCAVLVTSEPIHPKEVREHLHERVPEFMIPTEIALRSGLPLNSNMKVDRRRVIAEFHESALRASIMPRDVFELELLQMISEVSTAPIGLDDPLFDGALHSLAIMRLVQRINRRVDGALTFADLQTSPTVTHLAAFLRRAKTSEFRQLIRLKDGTTRRSLVLFHPGGGTCLPYKPLIDALPAELTVYGVECPNLYRPRPEVFTVEQMVECYYADVSAIAAEQPLALGGWSLGGYIAYETARRMRAAGRPVGLVLVMDSVIIDDRLQEFARLVGKPNVGEFLRGHFAGYWEHLDDAERERQRVTHELALDATLAYKPGPYEGDIALAKAGQYDELPPGSDVERMQEYVRSMAYNGWEASCTGHIAVCHTPTKHNDLVSAASAPMLAAFIAERLGHGGRS
jgi:amino acid adenylation domain-containing protein